MTTDTTIEASSNSFALAAPTQNLKRLILIRLIVLAGQYTAFAYSLYFLNLTIPYEKIGFILFILTMINAVTALRIRRSSPITDVEFLVHLLIDILGLSALLYYTGGASNPFVSYFLVPITISAAILPSRYTWITSISSLLCYSLLLFYFIPLDQFAPSAEHSQHASHGSESGTFNLHIIGMWFNFSVSAVLITFFVVRMANALRAQESSLNLVREDYLRDEQILAVATIAAGTAHELGTPLSTMAVLLKDLEKDPNNSKELLEDIKLLQTQVSTCKKTLQTLTSQSDIQNLQQIKSDRLDSFLQTILDQWQLLRPEVSIHYNVYNNDDAPVVKLDITTQQAISNLLNNAADASPERIDLSLSWTNQHWKLIIRDYGDGIALEIADQLGQTFVTTKGKGLGIGLVLTHASISRLGGTVKLYANPQGGTNTELVLPMN